MDVNSQVWQIVQVVKGVVGVTDCPPAHVTLQTFGNVCDMGEPGKYRLRAGTLILATAIVKRGEFSIAWKPGRIFYALGQAGALSQVGPVTKFLETEGLIK